MKRLALMAALMFALAPVRAEASEIMVSAAMSLRGALEQVARAFEARTPGVRVTLNFSSSGALRQQIEAGAPVDVFASASARHMDMLENAGLVEAGTRRAFARNAIVMAVPVGSPVPDGFMHLADSPVERIAMGNPDTSPAGQYAREALVSMGLWDAVRPKLVYAETVRQVLDYLVRAEVDAGLLYATDAALLPGAVRVAATAPEGSHSPVVYPVAVLSGSAEGGLARAFVEFLTESVVAHEALRAAGFAPPGAGGHE
jgi:molybdate transport system substrate-binding protein